MLITKVHYGFSICIILCVLSVFLFFIMYDSFNGFIAYGIGEKSLFFGRQRDISLTNGTSELPQIAVQGNYVYVTWQDNTSGNYDVLFAYSSDNGNSFSRVHNLSNNSGTSELPQIAMQGNYVYVTWQDNTSGNYDVYFGRFLSNATLFKERNLSKNNGASQFPQIAVRDNNVFVAWQDNTSGNYDILFRRSASNGDGFKNVKLRVSNGTSQFPQIAVQSNIVFVAWQDNSSGNYEIFLQRVLLNGSKYSSRNISDNNGTSVLPQISASTNDIYLMWKDNDTGNDRIFFKHIQKDDQTEKIEYGSTYKLNHSGYPTQAKITAGSDHFYGAWTADLKKNFSAIEFYPFMLLEDNAGASIPLTRLSGNESASNPDLATRNGDTFLVWEGETAGNKDIFFKKFSTNFFERK